MQKYGRVFEPGELIFEENDDGDHMFIIQDGQVMISRTINEQDTPVAMLEKGEFFGEMAIVNRIRRTASARAHARTQLLAFDRVGLEQLVEKNPKIALNIIDRLCRRLGSANAPDSTVGATNQPPFALGCASGVGPKRRGNGDSPSDSGRARNDDPVSAGRGRGFGS